MATSQVAKQLQISRENIYFGFTRRFLFNFCPLESQFLLNLCKVNSVLVNLGARTRHQFCDLFSFGILDLEYTKEPFLFKTLGVLCGKIYVILVNLFTEQLFWR